MSARARTTRYLRPMSKLSKPSYAFHPANPANTWQNRSMKKQAIVCHTIWGYFASLKDWFRNPDAVASTNFGIGQNGLIHCYVDPFGPHSPFANGLVRGQDAEVQHLLNRNGGINPNYYTISIEHEDKRLPLQQIVDFPKMFESSTYLSAWLCQEFKLDPEAYGTILGHYQFDSVNKPNCPGWNSRTWDAYITEVSRILKGGHLEEPDMEKLNELERRVKVLETLLVKRVEALEEGPVQDERLREVLKWRFDLINIAAQPSATNVEAVIKALREAGFSL